MPTISYNLCFFPPQQIYRQDVTFKNGNLFRNEHIATGVKEVDPPFSLDVLDFPNDMLIRNVPRKNCEIYFIYSVLGFLNCSSASVNFCKGV